MLTTISQIGSSFIQRKINTNSQTFQQIRGLKLTLLGAMSSVGQPFALLAKQSNSFREIAVQDEWNTSGLAMELDCIGTPGIVTRHTGSRGLGTALRDANIVVMAGGVPYDGEVASMSDLTLERNCRSVYDYSKACLQYCSDSIICVATAPVNCTMPIAGEMLAKVSKFFERRVMGVNTLHSMRASSCLSEMYDWNTEKIKVPIIGGCTPKTAVPLFSQVSPNRLLPIPTMIDLMKLFRQHVREENPGQLRDVSSLSQAYSAFLFVSSLAKSIKGKKGVVENAFVLNKTDREFPYLSGPVVLGRYGIESVIGVPPSASIYEKCLIKDAKSIIKEDVSLGLKLGRQFQNESEKMCAVY